MKNVYSTYTQSALLVFLFALFSIFQINNIVNQYFLGTDIGDARLYLDAFYNKKLNVTEDLGYSILLRYLGDFMGSNMLVTLFVFQSLLPLLATFYLCHVLKSNGLKFNFFAVMLGSTLWPFAIVFFSNILKDSLIQALLIFFVAETLKFKNKGLFYFIKFLMISAALFFLRPPFGILPIIILIALYIFNNFYHKRNFWFNKIFILRSAFLTLFGLISLALIIDLPDFATGKMGVLSYGDNFSTFIYGRSISSSLNYLPIYFGIFYLHPLGLPTGMPSMGVFLNNIIIIILAILALNRYKTINLVSSSGNMNLRYVLYVSGFLIFLHLIMTLPVIIDSGGMNVRHRLPSLYFLLISLILLSGVRARILLIIFTLTLPQFLFI